tara:strand:+ start:2984 stop:4027 length:1044 start_codon:yes stop_codon:yes gene_type:complete
MSDPRFYKKLGPFKLHELVSFVCGNINSTKFDHKIIDDIAALHLAKPSEISFFDNLKYRDQLLNTKAGACIIKESNKVLAPKETALIFSDNPYLDFTMISRSFYPEQIHPKSVSGLLFDEIITNNSNIQKDVILEKGVVIGKNVEIGNNSFIGSNAVIGSNVRIGENTYIGANVSITYAFIGSNVIIHQGTSIGQDGFGFSMSPKGHIKIPQVGLVVINDDVEIGSNCCIDRGSNQNTVIGKGTKIDNLVQIAHNCVIGEHCVLAGMVGLAGSTTLEDFVVMGAKSGATGHLTIGKGSQIAAKSGVTRDLPPGRKWAGFPIRSLNNWKKEILKIKKLTNIRRIKEGE